MSAPESVAAHSWGVAFLVLALCPPEVDRARALAMAVVHDLAEVRVGDLTPHDGVAPDEKHRREVAAFRELVAPFARAAELEALQREYDAGATPEARFVRACDKLDMALQATIYARGGASTGEFIESAREALDRLDHATLLDLLPRG